LAWFLVLKNLSDDAAEPIDDFIRPHESFNALNLLAAIEDDHRRESFDVVAAGEGGVFFGVDFDDLDTATEVVVHFFEDFGHHFAGAAPFRVEVHEDGGCSSGEEFVEVAKLLFDGHGFGAR
jgi:hypothetical protein